MVHKSKQTALRHCANWNAGKCIGAMMKSKAGSIYQIIDKSKAGKECKPDGCQYFDNIVVPGLHQT